MSLLDIQRRVFEAVTTPLTSDENIRPRTKNGNSMRSLAEEIIKPNDRLSSIERLELYNRQYWWRLLSSFNDDFVGLRAVVGNRRFDKLAEAYLQDYPSKSFTLRNLGRNLEAWLRAHPERTGQRHELAIDMVRLEWADIEAFDNMETPTLSMDDLQRLEPTSQLRLQPFVRLLDFNYPVDNLLLSIREQNEQDQGEASNTLAESPQRAVLKSVRNVKREPVYLAVHRVDFSVFFKRLDAPQFAVLQSFEGAASIAEALEIGFVKSEIPEEQFTTQVQTWFADWAQWGWFARPTSNPDRPSD
jgi:hypothetical protein